MAARQLARARADKERVMLPYTNGQNSKKKKKKFGGGAEAVNYFAEFSLNSRFLFSVIFFQDNGPTHLSYFV